MLIAALLTFIALCSASPMIRDPFDVPSTSDLKQTPVRPADPFFSFNGDENTGRIFHMDVDGIAAVQPKKTEKMPMQKRLKQRLFDEDRPIPDVLPGPRDLEFLQPQPGVAPRLTGSVGSGDAEESSTPINFDFFNFGEGDGPVVNPAATYLDGGNFEKVSAPKCVMQGCTGPLPNDGTFSVDPPATAGKACHQTFVPLNGCTDNKGYPMGMLCSICCDCTASFVKEMKKTHGYKIGYPA